MNASLFFDSTG